VYILVQSRQKKNFKPNLISPSNAQIDQTLPPEIFCEVLTLTDVPTLARCAQVSKYWNYYSTSNSIKQHAYSALIESTILSNELLGQVLNTNIDFKALERLHYPPYYKQEWHAHDALIAKNQGKLLLDVEISSLSNLNLDHLADRLLLKIRMNARLSSVKTHADFYYFKRGPKIFRVKPVPAMKSIRVEQEYDFIIDVPEYGTFNTIGSHWLTNIRGFREISNPDLTTDKIKEFLPTGTDWPRIAVLLFAPSIIQDYLNMNAPNAKYVVNMAFGLVSLVIFIFNIFNTIRYRLDAKILRNLITWTMAITMVLLWITNKAAKEISVFAAMMATVVLYLQTVKNYYYYPHNVGISRNIIAAVIAWNLFLVDWKSIFAATISGQILYVLIFHAKNYLILVLYYGIIHMIDGLLHGGKISSPTIQSPFVRQILFSMSWSVIVFTLYSPSSCNISV
jgi:hypothetical protein